MRSSEYFFSFLFLGSEEITLIWGVVDLETGGGGVCILVDNLIAYNKSGATVREFCDANITTNATKVNGDSVFLHFHSDHSSSGTGFSVQYTTGSEGIVSTQQGMDSTVSLSSMKGKPSTTSQPSSGMHWTGKLGIICFGVYFVFGIM